MQNFKFDVDRVTEQLNRILQMELAGVIYYTHYSFAIYGHARIRSPSGCERMPPSRSRTLRRLAK